MDDRIGTALFLPNLEIGGAETLVLNLVDEFIKEKGFAFHLILLGRGGKLAERAREAEKRGDFKFTEFDLPLRHSWKAASVLNRYLTSHGIGLVHSHLYICDKTCIYLKILNPGVKVVTTKHCTIPQSLKLRFANFLSQFLFSKIVFITPFQRAYYRRTCMVFRNTAFIENGSPLPPAFRAQDRLAKVESKVARLICLGAFRPEKGQDILAAALNLLARKGALFTGDFFGDGPELEKVKASLEPAVGIRFLPSRPGIARELDGYDLVVIPSRREASPLVLLESFLAKVPVIASDYPTLYERAGGGRRAVLFKSENAEDLAEKIGAFLGNPNGQAQMVEAAHRYALDFSIEKTASSYLRLYREVGRPGGAEPNHAPLPK